MKLRIKGSTQEKKENEVAFWLNEDSNGDITLMAKSSEDDKPGKILWICKAGQLNRYSGPALQVTGIEYDIEGKIVLDR